MDGPNSGKVLKQLRYANLHDTQFLKSLATHVQSLQRLNKFPVLLVPRLLKFGMLGGRPSVIETKLPGALGTEGASKLAWQSSEIRLKYWNDLFKFFGLAHKMGVLPFDVKINDTVISDKPFPLIPSVGLVNLGGSFIKGSEFNVRMNEQKAWNGAT